MSRSSQHKERHGKSSGIPLVRHDEGTAARTRPLSFDEIMSRREKKKKQFDDEKEGTIEDITTDRDIAKVSERDTRRIKDSSSGIKKHLLEGDAKPSSRKKKESTSVKNKDVDESKDRRTRDSETKLKPAMNKDLKARGRIEEKIHGRRKSDERQRQGNMTENEALNKHSKAVTQTDRRVDGSRGKYERESKRKERSVIDERNRGRHPTKKHEVRTGHDRETSDRKEIDVRNRDGHPTKKHDVRKGHDRETSDRKENKELSKSRYEELKLKRKRSRSREGEDRNRRSISPLPRSHKRASYHSREHGELSSYSNIGRSEWQHSDTDRSKNTNNGSSGQHRRHGGSTSGLGGYSPRKRRSEAGAKTPSPPKRSPEKKNARWDLEPQESHKPLSVAVPSDFRLPNKIVPLNINVALGTVPVPSITVKPLSGVPSSILSTNKNNPLDPVQLTQATRPRRRLYVENIPASASEKAVLQCLNNFLTSSGVNYVKGTQPCISCIINKEKSQALVEFLTPEDASAALHFDGSFFAGSIIKIRRPKDFVELATGEAEKSVAAVETISNIVKDSPHKIFIGGISKTLSSEMIMEIASSFGPLKAYHFENSDHQNEPHAFLEYVDQSVTSRACAGLNGMKLGGQVLTVLQVYPNASTLESNVNSQFNGIPDHAKSLLENPTQVLKLKNLFDPENLLSLSETEIEEVLEDVRLECVWLCEIC
ncbi:uncharacterized protein [Euphorbia lathyris]|uniref:uncharacterized protein isoform X2 n=1 Tax=Euphorbia lathyris TaxID=212925 RepID=UPI0033138A5C